MIRAEIGLKNRQIIKVVRSNPVHGEEYLIQHYVMKFVSDLRQVGGFLRIILFPPPIKLTATIYLINFIEGNVHFDRISY
jgi:hypothetical protein